MSRKKKETRPCPLSYHGLVLVEELVDQQQSDHLPPWPTWKPKTRYSPDHFESLHCLLPVAPTLGNTLSRQVRLQCKELACKICGEDEWAFCEAHVATDVNVTSHQ